MAKLIDENLTWKRSLVSNLLLSIGDDPLRDGLRKTPDRVIKMWKELFYGYDPRKFPKITRIKNGQDGINYNDLIIDSGYFFSHCEHHVVPFFGDYWLGYIPGDWLIGASKISRIIDYHSARLQVAERLVHDVCDSFEKFIQPKGLILMMSGRHLCKEMRGIRKYNSPFEVIAVRGLFEANERNCKEEFLSRIRR